MVAASQILRRAFAGLALLAVLPGAARAAWTAPARLGPARAATMQQLLLAGDGRVTALWAGALEGATLWRADAGASATAFGRPRRLVRLGSHDIFPQARDTAAGGRAVVVFERRGGYGSAQVVGRVQRGGGFTAPVVLSTPGSDARAPQLAMDAAGDALAAWRLQSGVVEVAPRPRAALRFRRRAVLAHSRDARADYGNLAVAVGPRGRAVVAYAARGSLWAAVGSVGHGLRPPVAIGPATDPSDVSAAITATSVALAWTSGGVCRAGLGRARTAVLGTPATAFLNPAPALALAPGGRLTVACPGDGPLALFTTTSGAFAGPGEPVGTAVAPVPAALASGPDGDTVAVWLERGAAGAAVTAAGRGPGAVGFSAPETLAPAARGVSAPLVAVGRNGRAVAIWAAGVARAAFRTG